jgi:hypothetical protein
MLQVPCSALQAADPAELVRAAVTAYRRGESEYRAGLFEAGRLCGEYIIARLCVGEKRAAAVELLARELARCAGGKVNVSRLVLVYQSYRLLSVEQGLAGTPDNPCPADGVPYGVYRDLWCRLVERTGKDTAQEGYVLLPGLEAECRAAFAKAVADVLPRRDVAEQVTGLLRQKAGRQAAAERPSAVASAPARESSLPTNLADQRGQVTGCLLKSAAVATPANLAESLLEQLEASADPHDAMERLMARVAAAPWADRAMKRGAQAALLSLTRRDATNPVRVAEQLTGAAHAGAPAAEQFALDTRFVG